MRTAPICRISSRGPGVIAPVPFQIKNDHFIQSFSQIRSSFARKEIFRGVSISSNCTTWAPCPCPHPVPSQAQTGRAAPAGPPETRCSRPSPADRSDCGRYRPWRPGPVPPPADGKVQQLLVNVQEKAGGISGRAVEVPSVRLGEVQALLRSRQRHEGQPPLLLHGLEGPHPPGGEDALVHAAEETRMGTPGPLAAWTVISFTLSPCSAVSALVNRATWGQVVLQGDLLPQVVSYSYTDCFSSARLSSRSWLPSVRSIRS